MSEWHIKVLILRDIVNPLNTRRHMIARLPAVFAITWSLESAPMHLKSAYDICACVVRRRKCLSHLKQKKCRRVTIDNPGKEIWCLVRIIGFFCTDLMPLGSNPIRK